MDLRATILKNHSKIQRDLVIDWVGTSQRRFDELFAVFLANETIIAHRAAWAVSYAVEAHPALIQKHLGALIIHLRHPDLHDGILRHSTRILEQQTIPEEYHGILMDACFYFLEEPTVAVAIKAFSMGILGKLAKTYPEIIPEIKLLIDAQVKDASPGFKSKSKHVLKVLDRYKS